MPQSLWYSPLPSALVVEIRGSDAAKILNNLCTNDIAKLADGGACEAFVTNVRGWAVAYCVCFKTTGGVALLGSHADADAVCNHVDRYIIREDATVSNLSASKQILVVSSHQQLPTSVLIKTTNCVATSLEDSARVLDSVIALPATISGEESGFLVVDESCLETVKQSLDSSGFAEASGDQLELARIVNGWPYVGPEIQEKTLPQEMDRDAVAISFTKGCYLGQETIARLDARGQLQKKLCRLQLDAAATGQILTRDGKEVGTITSKQATPDNSIVMALAMLKRGNFESGLQLKCGDGTAKVV